MLEYWQAVLLGIIQGATEFLPVSSSGHLALTQMLVQLDSDSPQMLLFDVATHLATLAAVGVVFFPTFQRFLLRLWRDVVGRSNPRSGPYRSWFSRSVAVRITLLGVAASVPTAVIGLVFKDTLEAAFGKPLWVGAALAVTGTTLLVASHRSRTRNGWRRFSFAAAFLVGIAQGVAILPGISRSGATICTAILCGLRRRWAAEFSFFIAMPAILGATVLKAKDILELPPGELSALPIVPILVGCVVAFAVGLVALKLLLAAVRRMWLTPFAFYCFILAATVMAVSLLKSD